MKYFLFCTAFFLCCSAAVSQQDIYSFSSDDKRESFETLTQELRCPKCLNQNLADSDSEISKIMRDVIVEELEGGMSEEGIKQMMVERYSEFVLYDPPVKKETMLLWLMPLLMLIIGGIAFVVIIVRRQNFLMAENVSAEQETESKHNEEEQA